MLILFSVFPVFTQDLGVSINKIIVMQNPDNITGAETIRSRLRIYEGQSFSSARQLYTALDEQRQLLLNTRYFSSLDIKAAAASSVADSYDVSISYAEDLTFFPIPYAKPDSSIGSNGWSFGLKTIYDNSFGTMTDFFFEGSLDFAFGEVQTMKGWEIESSWSNITVGNSILSVEYMQTYKTTEVTDPSEPEGFQLLQHYTNHESILKTVFEFEIDSLWTYSISPEIGFRYLYSYHHDFEGQQTQENSNVIEDRIYMLISNSIGQEKVDWIGAFRDGWAFDFTNNMCFIDSYDIQNEMEFFRFATDIELSGRLYKKIGSYFNYYTKLETLAVLNDYQTELGERLRGVKNSSMYGDLGIFWLNTLGIELFGSESFHLQLHPFIDTGIVFYTKDVKPISDILRVGIGTEGVLMLGSIDIKGKIGYDPVSDYLDFSFTTDLSY